MIPESLRVAIAAAVAFMRCSSECVSYDSATAEHCSCGYAKAREVLHAETTAAMVKR